MTLLNFPRESLDNLVAKDAFYIPTRKFCLPDPKELLPPKPVEPKAPVEVEV